MPVIEKKKEIYLVGYENEKIGGVKLPTNEQVLSLFFFKLRTIGLSVSQSALDTVKETEAFWNLAELPMNRDTCVRKLKSIYKEWYTLSKSRKRKSAAHANNENKFKCKLKETFCTNFLNDATLSEDQQLLLHSQRQPLRRGFINRGLNDKKKDNSKNQEHNLNETDTEGKLHGLKFNRYLCINHYKYI